VFLICLNLCQSLKAKSKVIESFDSFDQWTKIVGENAKLEISVSDGKNKNAFCLTYDLGPKKSYVVISKKFSLKLPQNYKFTFYLKGEGINNLEFKLIDDEGNTFWKKFENKKFSSKWEKVVVSNKDITYAWGPKVLDKISVVKKIEFGISGGETQQGTVWFDELELEESKETKKDILKPVSVSASSQELDLYPPENIFDGKMNTRWSSQFADNQWLEIDLGKTKKLSGMTIFWEAAYTKVYDVLVSQDKNFWKKVYTTQNGDGGRDEIFFPPQDVRFIKLNLYKRATSWGNSIYEIVLRPKEEELKLTATPSAKNTSIYNILDNDPETFWHSGNTKTAVVNLNFGKEQDVGGIFILWDKDFAKDYTIDYSFDGKNWQNVKTIKNGNGNWDKFYFEKLTTKYLRINCEKSATGNGFGIKDIEIKGGDESATPLRIYEIKAEESPAGFYPIWLSKKQIYWTIAGALEDEKEVLLSEFGDVEPDKGSFSIMPFLYIDNKVITRDDVTITHKLEDDYLPIPSVIWSNDKFNFEIKTLVYGKEDDSVAYVRYKLKNLTQDSISGKLYLTIRPFQVNPPWQYGGLATIKNLSYQDNVINVDDKKIFPITKPQNVGFVKSSDGDIVDYLNREPLSGLKNEVYDETGFASGVLEYKFFLSPQEEKNFYIAIPLHKNFPMIHYENFDLQFDEMLQQTKKVFEEIVNKTQFDIPKKDVLNTMKSNLLYLLINKDKEFLQPGSRNYQRAWMRDGALMCRALLNMGYTDGIKDFIDLFARNQFSNGKIPAVIDKNGVDPIDEYDSQGEFIYAILQYYYHTKDKSVLEKYLPNIKLALEFLVQLRNKRLSEEYRTGSIEKQVLYGILPESVSHEGYFNPPRHSYWDDFWALKGFKDAKTIAKILGKKDLVEWIQKEENALRESVKNSINLVMKHKNIDYLPGCAELGDFDPTSSAIAVAVCGETKHFPSEIVENTFKKYYEGKNLNLSGNYSPYEVRIIEAFVVMGQKEKANNLLKYLLNDRRPLEWNHFAEVVHGDYRLGQYIGDMPHTWIGAEYINSVRSMFVVEDEDMGDLLLCKGLTEDWFQENKKIEVKNLPTLWGKISYKVTKEENKIVINISGNISVPKEIIFFSPINLPIKKVEINNKIWKNFSSSAVRIQKVPSEIVVYY
jgi:hypothetical protein